MVVPKFLPLFIVSAILACCESSFVDTLPRCRAWDNDCQKNVMQAFMQNVGTTGIHDLDVNQIDPLDISGLSVPVFDLIEATLTEGVVTGIRDCTIAKFSTNIDVGLVSAEIICDILAKGKFRMSSHNPFIKIFLGTESLHGDASGQIKIDKLKIAYDYPFDLVRKNNDLYINGHYANANYTFDVLGDVKFYAGQDVQNDQSSGILVRVLNDNWRLVMNFVWRHIRDVSSGYIYDFSAKFFNHVPLKYFVSDDFTTHVYG